MDAVQAWIVTYGYIGLFVFLVMGIVGVPLPEDLLLACAGYLIFEGYLKPWPTYTVAFLGSVGGITVSYLIGRWLGIAVIERRGHRLGLTPKRLATVVDWYARFGKWTLTFGYYIGGFRHVNALLAGALKLGLPSFAFFAYLGAFIWSASIISAGYVLGRQWALVSGHAGARIALLVTIVLVIAAYYVYRRRRTTRESMPPPAGLINEAKDSEGRTDEP